MMEELDKKAQNVLEAISGSTISSAESLTGGLLGATLTRIPGASAVYCGGVIAYTNAMKISLLGVNPESLAVHGAVSEQVAREMAEGALERTGSDYALSTTGFAGPEGQVGKAFIAVAWRTNQQISTEVRELSFPGNPAQSGTREAVRRFCVAESFDLLLAIC